MQDKIEKVLEVKFFANESGKEPVREWLKELPIEEKKTIGRDIATVEFEWPIGKPLVENLGKGLWEVRTKLKNKIARTIFLIDDDKMILLHGFIKKTQKTPKSDLDLANKRAKTFFRGNI